MSYHGISSFLWTLWGYREILMGVSMENAYANLNEDGSISVHGVDGVRLSDRIAIPTRPLHPEDYLFGGVRDEDLTDEQRADMKTYYDHIARWQDEFFFGLGLPQIRARLFDVPRMIARRRSRRPKFCTAGSRYAD